MRKHPQIQTQPLPPCSPHNLSPLSLNTAKKTLPFNFFVNLWRQKLCVYHENNVLLQWAGKSKSKQFLKRSCHCVEFGMWKVLWMWRLRGKLIFQMHYYIEAIFSSRRPPSFTFLYSSNLYYVCSVDKSSSSSQKSVSIAIIYRLRRKSICSLMTFIQFFTTKNVFFPFSM